MQYAVVDVETTGLRPATDRIVEIAIVALDDGGETQWSWTTLINPQRDVGPTHIHGIRAGDIQGAPTFGDFAGRIAQLLQGRMIVAHNAEFDISHIRGSFVRAGVADLVLPHVCTMEESRRQGIFPTKLSDVCDYFDVVNQHPHQAIGDAMATAEVWRELLQFASPLDLATAEQELASVRRWSQPHVLAVDAYTRPNSRSGPQ